ncbi:hypothetical protein [Maridesulfovibrio sp.]|uniref:hypothetical protein n=1 Tax=Maridesulfovibrio sp. TaxID=2795000 RepID=UPI0039EDF878
MDLNNIITYAKDSKYPVVAFVIRPGFYTAFVYLAEKILENNINLSPILIVYGDYDVKDSKCNVPFFHIDTTDLSELCEIKVFVDNDSIYGLTFYYPVTSNVVCIPHAFMETEDIHGLGYESATFEFGDALCLPHAFSADYNPKEYEEAWGNKVPPPVSIRDKKFNVIPCGYLKVDIVAERIERESKEKDSILIAPGANIPPLPSFYQEIVQVCLDTCSEYKVIFRPYPLAKKAQEVLELHELYRKNDRVIIDLSGSNIESLARAKVYVTDFSLGRLTFSLATGQPHIVFRPDLNSRQQLVYEELGFLAYTEEQLVEALKLSIKSKALRRQVVSCRDEKIVNFGKSLDVIIDSIIAYAEGVTRNYWIEFDRKYIEGEWEKPEYWVKYLLNYPRHSNERAFYSQCYHLANKRFPDHPFFKMPLIFERYVVKLNHSKKTFRLLTQEEIESLNKLSAMRPPYAVWANLHGYNNTPKDIYFYVHDSSCLFITTLSRLYWDNELYGKRIMPNNAVFRYEIEYLYNLGDFRTLLALQVFLGQSGWCNLSN